VKTLFLICAAFLGALVIALQLTAHPVTTPGVPELTWATDGNPTRQEQMDLFKSWYREKYGVPIGIHIDPSNYDPAKIVVQSVAGSGPDLFDYFSPTSLQAYVDSGIMTDITDVARQGNFAVDRFWPALKTTLSMRGRQYGVPDNAVGYLMLVREDLLRQHHLSAPRPGWTWHDLVTLAQALTEYDQQGHVTRFGILGIQWMDLILQNGAGFFNPTETRCILNRPDAVEALQFYYDLRTKYHVLASPGEIASMAGAGGFGGGSADGVPNYLNLFLGGHGATIEYGRYGYILINRVNKERQSQGLPELRIIPLPPLTQKCANTLISGRCTGINRRTIHPKEALRFLEFLATKSFGDQIDRSSDSLATIPEFATGPGGAQGLSGGRPPIPGCDDPYWLNQASQGASYPCSRFVSGAVFYRILKEETDRLDSNMQTPAQTAARMQDRVNRAIADYLKVRPDLNRQWHELEAPQASDHPL